MLCKNCNKEHSDADRFCPFCGNPVPAAPDYGRTKIYQPSKPAVEPKPEKPADKPKPDAPKDEREPERKPAQVSDTKPPEADGAAAQQQLAVSWHDEGSEELIDDEERREIKRENRRFLIVECLLLALVLCLIGAIFFTVKNKMNKYDVYTMDGVSMEDTIKSGDKLSAEKMAGAPKSGDIAVISGRDDSVYIRRVIAVGGQTLWLDYDNDRIVVDGVELSEPYIKGSTYSGITEDYAVPLDLPKGKVFVMGDNRGESLDSRSSEIGLIDEKDIIGKVVKINDEDVAAPTVNNQEETK